MKNIRIIWSLLLAVLFLSSCKESSDFDVEYTPIAPVGGLYVVTVTYGYDGTKTDAEYWASSPTNTQVVGKTNAYLTNTSAMDTDKAWVRVSNSNAIVFAQTYTVTAKVDIDMSTYKFSTSGTTTIDGNCQHNLTMDSGTVTDYISFSYSTATGHHFKAEGWKYTGWSEEN